MWAKDFTFYGMSLLYGMALWNCYRVLGSRHTPAAAIAWILINMGMPVVGVPLYFLVGNNRLQGYVKRHRTRARETSEENLPYQLSLGVPPKTSPEEYPAYEEFKRTFSRFGPVFEPYYGTAGLLVDGNSTFKAIFEAIESAQAYILVQYYILRSDRLGLELKRLLIAKAKSGIPVFILYDDMGSFWLSRNYIRDLRQAGAKVARFLPVTSFNRFFQINFRNHRKLVVVDGLVAFTGGLNVGEEYITPRSKTKIAQRYWRDTHIRVTGASVHQLEEIFLEDWSFATAEKIELARPAIPCTGSEQAPSSVEPNHPPPILQVIPTGPADETLISILFLMQFISMAKKRLWIATPYFIPDPALIRVLELAVLRGVEIKLILPAVSDYRFVHWVSMSYAEQIQSRGVEVLLYEEGFMHQKVLIADDHLASIGTMNIDNRALYLNFETMIVVHGRAFNAQLEKMLKKDFTGSRFLKRHKRPWVHQLIKFRANIARLLAPLL